MNRSTLAVLIAAGAALASPSLASAQTATVYSSLSLSGASRVQTRAINDGARQALQEAGGMAGGSAVKFVTLNDATSRTGSWVAKRVANNARRAAQDDSAVALIGAFNSGASAIAIPITNEAGLAMVSPSNTAIGLTTGGAGAGRREPTIYYPTGKRTYFRIIPNDKVQADALATAMRDRGCKTITAVHDGEVYGKGVGTLVRRSAARLGMKIARTKRISDRTRRFGALRADCLVYTGVTDNGAVRLFRAAPRKAWLFASDGVAETGFTGHLPASVAKRVTVSIATLAPDAYGPAGAAIIGTGDPYKLYGYEAMKLILDGLNTAGPTKAALLGYLQTSVQNRASVLGTYSLDANGDTTLRSYGLYGVSKKALVWQGPINAA
jgi:branched-chain amino acid transport system substrate-binding protein